MHYKQTLFLQGKFKDGKEKQFQYMASSFSLKKK